MSNNIVESGKTLKENDLGVITEIFPISARFISNRASYKFKTEAIDEMISKLSRAVSEEEQA